MDLQESLDPENISSATERLSQEEFESLQESLLELASDFSFPDFNEDRQSEIRGEIAAYMLRAFLSGLLFGIDPPDLPETEERSFFIDGDGNFHVTLTPEQAAGMLALLLDPQ